MSDIHPDVIELVKNIFEEIGNSDWAKTLIDKDKDVKAVKDSLLSTFEKSKLDQIKSFEGKTDAEINYLQAWGGIPLWARLASPESRNQEEFQFNYLRAYRGFTKGKGVEQSEILIANLCGESIKIKEKLYDPLYKDFTKLSPYQKKQVLFTLRSWLSDNEINCGDWSARIENNLNKLLEKVEETNSPLLRGLGDEIREGMSNLKAPKPAKSVSTPADVKFPTFLDQIRHVIGLGINKVQENPLDINQKLNKVASGNL